MLNLITLTFLSLNCTAEDRVLVTQRDVRGLAQDIVTVTMAPEDRREEPRRALDARLNEFTESLAALPAGDQLIRNEHVFNTLLHGAETVWAAVHQEPVTPKVSSNLRAEITASAGRLIHGEVRRTDFKRRTRCGLVLLGGLALTGGLAYEVAQPVLSSLIIFCGGVFTITVADPPPSKSQSSPGSKLSLLRSCQAPLAASQLDLFTPRIEQPMRAR